MDSASRERPQSGALSNAVALATVNSLQDEERVYYNIPFISNANALDVSNGWSLRVYTEGTGDNMMIMLPDNRLERMD